jgi:hypothetical protein
MTKDNPCRIPNGRAIIFNFPAGAGGKMLQNCVGLSRHCVLNKRDYVAWQLNHPVDNDLYNHKLEWVLASVPPDTNSMENWLSFELGKDDEPHGINLFDFRKHVPITNPDTYKLAQAGLWCTVSVHNFDDSVYYKRYWPTLRYVSLINNENFAKISLPKKNKDITFDTTWSTLGITPRGVGFEFDVDYCIYNTEKFVQQVDQLYKWLDFDDFDADLVADYHRKYIKIH